MPGHGTSSPPAYLADGRIRCILNWARAVADESKTALQQEELRLIKKGEGS